jgi:solute carrier family 25 (mitochondrial S-adenosylmethionine transporter), member 26
VFSFSKTSHFNNFLFRARKDVNGVLYKNTRDTFTKLIVEGKSKNSLGSVFFAGIGPRVMWISVGGFFFFGAYEYSKSVLDPFI